MTSLHARALSRDIAACIGFYTRLPVPDMGDYPRDFAAAQWAAPVAGAVVGFSVGVSMWAGLALGVPATVAAAAALAAGLALTGALHEDGLADVADGFGGGRNRAAKLDIMRDSRLGSYGALALFLSLLARWSALVALAPLSGPALVLAAVAAHAASRATIPLMTLRIPPARADGLAAGMGRTRAGTALAAAALGLAALLFGGLGFAVVAAILLACVFLLVERLALGQIGGHTGDVLGALQQGGEIAVLAAAATLLVQT